MKKKILKKSKGRCFSAKKSQRIFIIIVNRLFQFFCRKAPRQCPAGLFFEKLVGGLEANNYEKENFIKVIGKSFLAKKRNELKYFCY